MLTGAGSVHLAELQHALAASCRATPRLRHAWLATLAEHNARQGDHDEVCHPLKVNIKSLSDIKKVAYRRLVHYIYTYTHRACKI